MADTGERALLERLEHAAEAEEESLLAPLAFLAAQELDLDQQELAAARRRALLVLAAGGDPHRELEPDGRAVRTLADDLHDPELRARLRAALRALQVEARGLPHVGAAADTPASDEDLAWRWVACALLAEEVGDST